MNEHEAYLWLALGAALGVAFRESVVAVFMRIFPRDTNAPIGPREVVITLPREVLDGVAASVSDSILTAIQTHIDDLKKPSKN
jgi:hypothetical protein